MSGNAMSAMIGTILTGFSTGLQAEGQMMSAKAQAEAYEFNATTAEQQAKVEEANARRDVSLLKIKMQKVSGAQQAAMGASGVTGGNLGDIISETTMLAMLDQQYRQWEGDMKAAGLRAQAEMYRYEGKMVKRGAKLAAASTKLAGMAQSANMWGNAMSGSSG
jgi:hypothetical protein